MNDLAGNILILITSKSDDNYHTINPQSRDMPI